MKLHINGTERDIDAPADMPLLWAIRDLVGLPGTKFGCGMAQCGACTVHLDGQPVRSCVRPVSAVGTRKITTIEGISSDGSHPVQRAWVEGGYEVIAVQNPLVSLANDIETTKRVIDARSERGPLVVVGHSYGGAVMTAAAAGNPNVKALVYVAAFAPDAGEAIGPLLEKYPSQLGMALVPDKAGFLYIDASKFRDVFAADVPERETRVMAVAQKPIFGGILGQSSAVAAWRTVPSWYLVAKQDQAINPELERFYARRMGAKTTEIASSHVAFISRPREVAKIIVEAAETISK